jgi:DNA-binding transcriptional regulator LsrR (DeoR family)
MKQMGSEVKQQQLDWRRAQVLDLASEGYNQREIASKLQIDLAAVNRDIQFLRERAQVNLQHHIHEVVPEEYQKCMVGMKRNLKQTLEIRDSASDPKTKLQAAAIANDCYRYIMDLCTNAGIVSDALKFVQRKKEQLDTLQKIDERIEEIEEEKTTNVIF